MPSIVATSIARAPFRVTQAETKAFAQTLFASSSIPVGRMAEVFDHAGVAERGLVRPLEWYGEQHSIQESAEVYEAEATTLARRAAMDCLHEAQVNPDDVDAIVLVSSTGLVTPTLDARLLSAIGLRPETKRLPLWGLGCAGGATGLARSYDLARAEPNSLVLLVTVETCSLAFQTDDDRKANFVASALFGDGAGAALVVGDGASRQGSLRIVGASSTTWPDSLDVMGWEFNDYGMQVVFSPKIPKLVETQMQTSLHSACAANRIDPERLGHFLLHPGGAKVLRAYEKALRLNTAALKHSSRVLYENGNMSSPTLLFVLDRFLKHGQPIAKDALGVLSALGPGFTAQHVFVEAG